jgi:MFS superfamily sulfate permease-like transporter
MYYANALTARDRLKAMIREASSPPRAVIFDAEGQDDLDVTSAQMLIGLVRELRGTGVTVYFANVHAPVLERAHATGLYEAVGDQFVLPTVDMAVRALETQTSSPDGAGGRVQP